MDSIDQLSNSFLSEAKTKELKDYCEKQYKEIIRLLQLNKKLEEEVEHLKKLLVDGTQLIEKPQIITNEELICIRQIDELKKISDSIVLTKEESQKLDTYVKMLRIIRAKASDQKDFLKDIKTDDLLKVVETDNVK